MVKNYLVIIKGDCITFFKGITIYVSNWEKEMSQYTFEDYCNYIINTVCFKYEQEYSAQVMVVDRASFPALIKDIKEVKYETVTIESLDKD